MTTVHISLNSPKVCLGVVFWSPNDSEAAGSYESVSGSCSNSFDSIIHSLANLFISLDNIQWCLTVVENEDLVLFINRETEALKHSYTGPKLYPKHRAKLRNSKAQTVRYFCVP